VPKLSGLGNFQSFASNTNHAGPACIFFPCLVQVSAMDSLAFAFTMLFEQYLLVSVFVSFIQ
jgi:hypothetical protein